MTEHGNAWVCTDCYFAHHYGAHEHEGEWYSGESDEPCDREPLANLDGYDLSDNTCSDHFYGQGNGEHECPICDEGTVGEPFDVPGRDFPGYVWCWVCDGTGTLQEPCDQCGSDDDDNGIQEFSWSSCDGCGSHLGGHRYRLAVWEHAA